MNRTRNNDDMLEARAGDTMRLERGGNRVILGEASEARRQFLCRAGELLYGVHTWQLALGRDLEVSGRTMRRWKAGESSIPEGIEAQLFALCKERAHKLLQLVGEAK